ncbi:MAG TPA: adenylate/guanylate cyclase domain-containing protein [Desulfobacterales bacterium]|nr:adenylate/guanylate cyclase domain-containing protein [Desulfobacterales bacterium]HIP40475.1 adenylate/guanylate cyclase domain-containing protein [Desulfocapsa sulfexigens]
MKNRLQNNNISFYRKLKVSLALMGILPFLLAVYLFTRSEPVSSTLIISSAALVLFSMLLGFTLLRKSSDQLQILAEKTAIDASGQIPQPLDLCVEGELSDIAINFNTVVEQLNKANQDIQNRSSKLREYENNLAHSYKLLNKENKLRHQLCRYVDKDLVDRLMESGDRQLLKNERKNVTVMFADIRSFTALSEHMEPEEVVAILNEYFTIMTDILFKHHGMLDKFVGDQIMAVFGHISNEKSGARSAVRAALEMQKATADLMKKRAAKKLPVFNVGIGINTGSAILASVGSENRQDYTVIGDTVNTAARLEKYAAGWEVVIGERTSSHLPNRLPPSARHELQMRNRSEPLACYTLMAKGDGKVKVMKPKLKTPPLISTVQVVTVF